MSEPRNSLLEVRNLRTIFKTYAGVAKAVDDVSFTINQKEMIGVVGESGCGKSVMARSILRLIKDPPGKIVDGEISLEGRNLLKLTEKEMRDVRGRDISMIFQEPMTSLNPVFTVGNQLGEMLRLHASLTKKQVKEKAIDLLKMVGIPAPENRVDEYPFQMSGGMRQRAMIAMAMACRPKLILADEPTTALDVTIQAQILELIKELQRNDTSVLLITHDLGVVAETVHKVMVMYTGRIVEQADVKELFNQPLHPYTLGLMESIPSLDSKNTRHEEALKEIKGIVPDLCNLPIGCSFCPRCHARKDICSNQAPELTEAKPGHWVRCWLYQ